MCRNTHLLVIGAQKAATTWIQHVLDYNENFFLPKNMQEIHFFDRKYNKGFDYYDKLYNLVDEYQITCDVTPGYLDLDEGPKRIFEYSKHTKKSIKFIIILREPVDRIYSAFIMSQRKGKKKSLNDALVEDSNLINKSSYVKHINNYLDFFSKDDFLFLLFDDVKNNKEKLFNQIISFLDIRTNLIDPYDGKEVNSGGLRKFNFISHIYKLGGIILRRLGKNKLLHKIKSSFLINKLNSLNESKYELSNSEKRKLQELKLKFKPEVKKLGKIIDKPNLLKKWNYDKENINEIY